MATARAAGGRARAVVSAVAAKALRSSVAPAVVFGATGAARRPSCSRATSARDVHVVPPTDRAAAGARSLETQNLPSLPPIPRRAPPRHKVRAGGHGCHGHGRWHLGTALSRAGACRVATDSDLTAARAARPACLGMGALCSCCTSSAGPDDDVSDPLIRRSEDAPRSQEARRAAAEAALRRAGAAAQRARPKPNAARHGGSGGADRATGMRWTAG